MPDPIMVEDGGIYIDDDDEDGPGTLMSPDGKGSFLQHLKLPRKGS
jgi:hypothetical protein